MSITSEKLHARCMEIHAVMVFGILVVLRQ